ncbi:MAG: site-specific integrase [Verrucomicrobiae bacterium]|nr:site-specific integrase [Verrucomicrobiae bacterium]
MAFLYKHTESRYWYAGFIDLSGKRRNRSTRTTNRKEAQKVADAFEEASRKHRTARQVRQVISEMHKEITGEDLPSLSTADFVTSWLERKAPETSKATQDFYRSATSKFLKFLGDAKDKHIETVTAKQILGFRNMEAKTLAAPTVNHDLKCLRMLFKAARREGLISEDPTEFVDTVRSTERKPVPKRRPFTMDELRKVVENCDQEWKSMTLFGLYTGQRLGDIATIVRSDIDMDRGTFKIITRKTQRLMVIPLAPPLLEFLKEVSLPKDPNDPIHPESHAVLAAGKKTSTLSGRFIRILAAAGLREKKDHNSTGKGRSAQRTSNPLSFHSLRHTATTLLHEAGVPPSVAQALIGHDSEAIHQVYVSVGDTALKQAAASFPRVAPATASQLS